MKIILIREAEADMHREAACDAAAFASAAAAETNCGIAAEAVRKSDASAYRIYTGTGRVGAETASLLFEPTGEVTRTPLLNDVALRPFCDTKRALPLTLWRTMGRVQWALGSARQAESRRETLRRAGEFLDALEREDRDCVVICGGLILAALKSVLRHRGYCLEGGDLVPRPLERIRATKQLLHCGGCAHNCLLTEPKCQTGANRAKGIR